MSSAALGVATGLELFGKDVLLPEQPRFSKPNAFDKTMRDALYLGASKQDGARLWSDRLIYGVSMSSLLWGPLMSNDLEIATLINMKVFAANSMVTNLFKISVARERPYHYYGTRPGGKPTDYASFISGHSSVAFSQAVANSILLSEAYPERKALIWSSLLGTAGLTAYLRVAGDMHYFTDVLAGAIVGSTLAWLITHYELNRFSSSDESGVLFEAGLAKHNNSGMKFNFALKIPLG